MTPTSTLTPLNGTGKEPDEVIPVAIEALPKPDSFEMKAFYLLTPLTFLCCILIERPNLEEFGASAFSILVGCVWPLFAMSVIIHIRSVYKIQGKYSVVAAFVMILILSLVLTTLVNG